MTSWYSVGVSRGGVGEVSILSDIGMGSDSVTASSFDKALKALGNVSTLHIRISSNGGDVSQGFAIFNMLSRHPAKKIVTIDGLAASMASVIAMAGDEIVMPSNSMLMIHNPWGGIVGEADQIISFGGSLAEMRDQIARTYSKRSGLSFETTLALMDRESWLSAADAVQLGLADRIIEPREIAASIDVSKFRNAPRSMFGAPGKARKPESFGDLVNRAYDRFNRAARPNPEPESQEAES